MSEPNSQPVLIKTPAPSPIKHSIWTRVFHHGSAIFILILWVLVAMSDELAGLMSSHPIGIHKAVGVVFLIWVIARLINAAIRQKMPALSQPKWQVAVTHLVHFGLYACMIAMPVVGILMSVYSGRPVDVFGIFSIPVFVSPNRQMAELFNELHTEVIFPLLLLLIGLHVMAAIYHQVILKDGLINRMK